MDLYERFYDFEKSNSLTEFYINDQWIYPLIRMLLFNEFFSSQKTVKRKKTKNVNWLQEVFLGVYWQVFRSRSIPSPDILYAVGADTRRLNNNYYENIYISPLIKYLSKNKHLIFEFPGDEIRHYYPIPELYIEYPDFSLQKIYLESRFQNFLYDEDIAPLKKIYNHFHILMNISFVKDRLNKFFILRSFFEQKLKKLNPKVIVLVNAYDYKKMALISAARKLNIPTIELQHGIIYKSHLAYIYPKVLSRELFPEYLLTYGEYFNKLVREHSAAFGEKNVIAVGFPYLELISNRKPFLPKHLSQSLHNKFNILVTSQWVIRDQLKEFIIKLAEVLPSEIHILYKTHPREKNIDQFYQDLNKKNITLVSDKTISSLELMKIAKIHTTVFSTSYFESRAFKLPNILIKIPGYSDNIIKFVDQKTTFLVDSPKDYINALLRIMKHYEAIKKYIESELDCFFKPQALFNISSFLNRFINK